MSKNEVKDRIAKLGKAGSCKTKVRSVELKKAGIKKVKVNLKPIYRDQLDKNKKKVVE